MKPEDVEFITTIGMLTVLIMLVLAAAVAFGP